MDIELHDYESYSRDNREYPTSSQGQRYTQTQAEWTNASVTVRYRINEI